MRKLMMVLAVVVALGGALLAVGPAAAEPQEVDEVCVSKYTGKARVGASCTPTEFSLTVEAGTTFGVDRYTAEARYLTHGNYPPSYRLVTTDGGPSEGGDGVVFCVQRYTGQLLHFEAGCPASPVYLPVLI